MIYINDKEHAFVQGQSLSDLFKDLNIDAEKGIAVALNNKVIPRSEWNEYIVKQDDNFLLIKATQGG